MVAFKSKNTIFPHYSLDIVLISICLLENENKSPFLVCNSYFLNPLPDHKILDWSKLKQIADDILKCI